MGGPRLAFGLLQDIVELRREQGSAGMPAQLIVAWTPGCLQSLPQKLPPSLQHLSEREAVPLEVFGERDGAMQGRRVLLRGGVYMQDRIGENELQENATRDTLHGRYLALWLFARALGLHAKLGLSLVGCWGNCRERLRKKFIEGPYMRAAYYKTLSTDILRVSKVGNQDDVGAFVSLYSISQW